MLLPIAALFVGLLAFLHPACANESEQVTNGRAVYIEYCQSCHGADGQKGEGHQSPIWGPGAQIKRFENAQGLFEYLQMLMPFDDPSKIDDQARWNVMAYILQHHGAIPPTETLDPGKAQSVPIQ